MRCGNCGHHVSDQYARVMALDEGEQPEVCPHCPNHYRDKHGRRREVAHKTPTIGGGQ